MLSEPQKILNIARNQKYLVANKHNHHVATRSVMNVVGDDGVARGVGEVAPGFQTTVAYFCAACYSNLKG